MDSSMAYMISANHLIRYIGLDVPHLCRALPQMETFPSLATTQVLRGLYMKLKKYIGDKMIVHPHFTTSKNLVKPMDG